MRRIPGGILRSLCFRLEARKERRMAGAGNEPFLHLVRANISSRCAGRGEGAPGGEMKQGGILHGSQQQQQQQHPLPAHQLLPHIQLIFPVAYEEHTLALTHKHTRHTHTRTTGLICNRAHSLPYLSILSHALYGTRTAADRPHYNTEAMLSSGFFFFSSLLLLLSCISYLASDHQLLVSNNGGQPYSNTSERESVCMRKGHT